SSLSSSSSSEKPPAEKALKIRLYPNSEEKQKLLKWFGTARWTYNQCLAAINNDIKNKNKKYLRANYIVSKSEKFEDPNFKWVLDTPNCIRDAAMMDLLKNYKSNVAAKKKNFKLKFRSKKDKSQSIVILSRDWGRKSGEFFFLKGIKSSEEIPEIKYDCRLTVNRLGEFYLCIPKPLEIRADNQGPKFSVAEENRGAGIISLDPGVRTFMTGYNPSGEAIEWGEGDISRLYRLCSHYDRIQSGRDSIHGKENKRKRYKLRRCMLRIHKKIRNLVDECHRKLARWLYENHHVVLLPEFKTKDMVKSGGFRKIQSKTARQMMTWSHFRFRQHLLHKSREYPWCKVVICTEEYTSKTCGCCGVINPKLGGQKTFNCTSCGSVIDRDVNGARNILLKYLTEKQESFVDVGACTRDTLL